MSMGSKLTLNAPDLRLVRNYCRKLGLQVVVPQQIYRFSDSGDTIAKDQLVAMVALGAPLHNGRPLSEERVKLGLRSYELDAPVYDPLVTLIAQLCDSTAEDPALAWSLARQAAGFPNRYGEYLGIDYQEVLDMRAAALLAFIAQTKLRMQQKPLGDLAGMLYLWGGSGSGKSSFAARFLTPLGSMVGIAGSMHKLLTGFDGMQVTEKAVILVDDMAKIREDNMDHFKGLLTGKKWRAEVKYEKPVEVPIICTLMATSNRAPGAQFSDPAMGRRLYPIHWGVKLPEDAKYGWHNTVLPEWDVETLWKVAPQVLPPEWTALVEKLRNGFAVDSPINQWIEEYTEKRANTTPVKAKPLFQHFMAVAEEGNWQVRKITDKVFKNALVDAGFEIDSRGFVRGLVLVKSDQSKLLGPINNSGVDKNDLVQ